MIDAPGWRAYKRLEFEYSRMRDRRDFPGVLACFYCPDGLHEVDDETYLLAKFLETMGDEKAFIEIVREWGESTRIWAGEQRLDAGEFRPAHPALIRLGWIATSMIHHGLNPRTLRRRMLSRKRFRLQRLLSYALAALAGLSLGAIMFLKGLW